VPLGASHRFSRAALDQAHEIDDHRSFGLGGVTTMVGELRRAAAAVGLATLVTALVGCGGSASSLVEPTPATALQGPTWRLTSIAGQAVLDGTTITAEFSSESRVLGRAGCNSYFGGALADAGTLKVGPLASTLMACAPDAVMQQEKRYLDTLQAAKSYAIVGDELRLGPAAGNVTLVFAPR